MSRSKWLWLLRGERGRCDVFSNSGLQLSGDGARQEFIDKLVQAGLSAQVLGPGAQPLAGAPAAHA